MGKTLNICFETNKAIIVEYFLRATGLLFTAWLFGGMMIFAMGFAAFAFKVLPSDQARLLIRKAFPPFYLFVMATAFVAAALLSTVEGISALVLLIVALTTIPTRQVLMPAINRATDGGDKKRFMVLHTTSVLISLAHIAAAGTVLVWLIS
jgi:hypothetical protein